MKLKRITETEFKEWRRLGNCFIDAEFFDGALRAVAVTAPDGRMLVLRSDYSLSASTEAPPLKEKVFVLAGTVLGIKVEEVFTEMYKAEERRAELLSGAREVAELEIHEKEREVL